MHPFDDAASFFSATPAEGSFEPRKPEEEELVRAASSRGTRARAGGENAGIRCHQDCRHRAKAYCAHCCCSDRGFVCPPPGHVKTTSHVPAASQCSSERQQTTLAAASASTVAVDVEPTPKRPRRHALSSVAAVAPTTTSSVDQPIAATTAALERFAREVSMDAVFRRVRLGEGGGPEPPEVAYYTTVTIAGHVFRGVLYDVGPRHSGSSAVCADASDTDDGSGEVGSSLSTAGGSSCLDLALGL